MPVPNTSRTGILLLASILFALVLAEIVLRAIGYSPWRPAEAVHLQVESTEAFFGTDPLLGFALVTDRAKISVNALTFEVNHDRLRLDDSTEVLYRRSPGANKGGDTVWVFGGSYTYGWGVSNSETYSNVLGEELGIFVRNFAVPAYGTLQSTLQLNSLLKSLDETPSLVVFAHAPFHAERNVGARSWLKTLSAYNSLGDINLPALRPDESDQLRYIDLNYFGVPFIEYFALPNAIDDALNQLTDDRQQDLEILQTLLVQMAESCRQKNIRFVVLNLVTDVSSAEVFSTLSDQEIPFADVTVDLRIQENTLLPADSHPSARAHRQFAALAVDSVRQWLGR